MSLTLATLFTEEGAEVADVTNVRTARSHFNGGAVWVKRAVQKYFPLAPIAQSALEMAGMPDVLRCTYIMDRKRALRFEAGRLRQMAAADIRVPEVYAQSDDALVLSDVGASLWDQARGLKDSASRVALLEQGAVALAQLHVQGQFHGQPYPKNLTTKDGAVHFIDLEDDALSVMSLKDAQLRDLWMLCHGCWPFAKGVEDGAGLPARLASAYLGRATPAIRAHVKAGLPAITGTRGQILHAAAGVKTAENIRRFRWTAAGLRAAL